MRKGILATAVATILSTGAVQAQVGLDTYADRNGYIDVQTLTCDQLANTWQEDADALIYWYSGWYNGLAKKHMYHTTRAKAGEHLLIVYCKANRDKTVIHALDVLFKTEKANR